MNFTNLAWQNTTYKIFAFLYPMGKYIEKRMFEKEMPFKMSSKIINYYEINLTNDAQDTWKS